MNDIRLRCIIAPSLMLKRLPAFWLTVLLLSTATARAQQTLPGRVADAVTRQPLPFAVVRYGDEGQVADLEGRFTLRVPQPGTRVEATYIGYQPLQVETGKGTDSLLLLLQPKDRSLSEVIVKPPYEKIYGILDKAIAARDRHNPDKLPWYRCHVYYKMIADMPMDTFNSDSTGQGRPDSMHLLMAETYSIRTWKKPQKLQEEVVATRFSGFKKLALATLVTNVLPFHSYSDFLQLNGKDYPNPVSKGYRLRYDLNLTDELVRAEDTVWVISFFPRRGGEGLKGTVYISSDGFPITHLVAAAADPVLKRVVRMEQQYRRESGRWFPQQLNYFVSWPLKVDTVSSEITMKGTSFIDSVSFTEQPRYKFDKVHTVKLLPGADEPTDSAWTQLRPAPLTTTEARTYTITDSLMNSIGAARFLPYLDKLIAGKLPVGLLDLDLKRLYSNNGFEKNRLGLGLQTNERLWRNGSIGGWAAYGTGDKAWKWGGFAEVYGDRYRESGVRIWYHQDLRDPGRLDLHPEVNKAYLRRWTMFRADRITAYGLEVKKRFGYLQAGISGTRERIEPQYDYALQGEHGPLRTFEATEGSVHLRYAFAERTAPVFGRYVSEGTRYPVLYGKVTSGFLERDAYQTTYTQALAAVSWTKHLNRIGRERMLVTAGKSWSDEPLPLSKLFSGNGLRNDRYPLYSFGALMTASPYQFYSDAFVALYWQHTFDWKLYRLQLAGTGLSSAPAISVCYNGLWGTLEKRDAHRFVDFTVPDEGYHETGILLQHLLRVKYLNIAWLSFHGGYFYHWTQDFDPGRNGLFVFGFGIE